MLDNTIATFEKVAKEQFVSDCAKCGILSEIAETAYDDIMLPVRSSCIAATYDIRTPFLIDLMPKQRVTIPLGIQCNIDTPWVFIIVPRHDIGIKYCYKLDNTISLIDQSYYFSESQGHIVVSITNSGRNHFRMIPSSKIFSGIFLPYGITIDDTL